MSDRSYRCEGCNGVVAIPLGRRVFTLAQIVEHHEASCPAVRKVKR